LLHPELVRAHRDRALSPEHPVVRGTAQNPDAFFQAREAANGFYDACPSIVQGVMDRFADLTGRRYRLFEYYGHSQPERLMILMGSGAEAAHETVDWLLDRGEKVGLMRVRLYRPFSVVDFVAALPASVKAMAVMDRTKEPGGVGDPLYLDVVAALREARTAGLARFESEPAVIAGRYGLSSKEFNPAMVKAVFDELARPRPRPHFTVGINDDVTHLSLPVEADFDIEAPDVVRAVFYGLGSDGTVGANKNSVKIIAEETPYFAQGYFVYDSKKSGAVTVSHLRFGPRPLRSTHLIRRASFVACHQFELLESHDVLESAAPGAVFLLNAPYAPDEVWDHLPREVQEKVLARGLKLRVIDALKVAREAGMGGRINTIMQACFFAISGVLPASEAIACIKGAIEKTYAKRGPEVIQQNFAAVDAALAHLHTVDTTDRQSGGAPRPPVVSAAAPDFVQRVTAMMLAGKGDLLPVSAFPVDGTWPVATSQWEKRNLALEVPVWEPRICIQCNQCVLACPHAAIRAKVYEPSQLAGAPSTFLSDEFKSVDLKGLKYTLQCAVEDCTGCGLCVAVCPAKDKSQPRLRAINMAPQRPLRDAERENYAFFLDIPDIDPARLPRLDVKGSQLLPPLFEYSGACAGCGETPYVKLVTQLFGERALIANATGCSSIYGGNLPTTPYTVNRDGRGPAWANSLFEDNAEFGLGMRLALDAQRDEAQRMLRAHSDLIGGSLAAALVETDGSPESGVFQRQRVAALKARLKELPGPEMRRLETLADALVKKSVWLVGGDGWAYDIGYGGLDHVLASPYDVNVLVLDTEVYSNTGGQQSKATPRGASAKFAEAGKEGAKKDLGLLAMGYGHVYVAQIAFGAKMQQTVQALLEAEAHAGPSLVIAYSHCIAHGYDMVHGADQQKLAVESGVWPLYRFDPRRLVKGEPPLHLDSGAPRGRVADYMRNEARFRVVERSDPARFRRLSERAEADAQRRHALYSQLAGIAMPVPGAGRAS
ncbi:MAG TPA: pyruvate:ferredoxin (flavodoxin) oxidoreductase, partial [Vicinamibacteria bacterium]|nr:pyruvate:ferredoxin (flavodoxin) oxidoreductase [Vicinamibacteria bacterium]